MNFLSGIVSRSGFFASATTPCGDADTAKNGIAPTASGTEPPQAPFIILVATNERSTMTNRRRRLRQQASDPHSTHGEHQQ
jgi:hypothetical protein